MNGAMEAERAATTDTAGQALGLLEWVLWHRHHPDPTIHSVTITLPADTVERIEQLVGHDGEDLWS